MENSKLRNPFDREEREEYSFSVSVTDKGSPPRTATVNVKVTVLDDNDNDPVFDRSGSYIADVEENQRKGTIVAQVSARDSDKGENSTITYDFGKYMDQLSKEIYRKRFSFCNVLFISTLFILFVTHCS